jgi:hypothetical protein
MKRNNQNFKEIALPTSFLKTVFHQETLLYPRQMLIILAPAISETTDPSLNTKTQKNQECLDQKLDNYKKLTSPTKIVFQTVSII